MPLLDPHFSTRRRLKLALNNRSPDCREFFANR